MPINSKDPDDSAGRLFSWLCVNNACLIEEHEHYYRPHEELIVYQLWQTLDGEYIVREATWHPDGGRPLEQRREADSVEDFRENVWAEIEDILARPINSKGADVGN